MAEVMNCLHNGCCVYMRNKMEHLRFLTFIQPHNNTLWRLSARVDARHFLNSFLSVFPFKIVICKNNSKSSVLKLSILQLSCKHAQLLASLSRQ